MVADLNNKEPINPEEWENMLRNLQGNILKGHGRDYSRCIFFKLNEPENKPNDRVRADFRAYLAQLADNQVIISAWKQHIESQNYKKYETPGSMFGNLFLTARGYRKLEFDPAELPEARNYFLNGMSDLRSVEALKDPAPKTWEDGYKDGQIDAMILLADNNEDFLEHGAGRLMAELREFSEILAYERGNVLRKGNNNSVEHFGYADGLSQPVFLSTDTDLPEPGNRNEWDPTAPLDLVLVEDKLAKSEDCFGSYLVFRKLEQDVIGFEHGKRNLTEQFGLKESDHQKVGAMMIGRFEEGTSLALSDKALISRTGSRSPDNNFTYANDPEGDKCPVYAHIRVTNPRTEGERPRRIARRGIPYGKRPSWDRLPTEPVGLLFMCLQRSIENQFVHMQQRANAEHDPVIGQEPDLTDPPQRGLPAPLAKKARLKQEKTSVAFDTNWVKLRGGEFFFAPSIQFLKDLKPKLER